MGCSRDGDEEVAEVAMRQAEGVVEQENRNLAQRASEMEEDLYLRHQYFSALSGVYEGVASSQVENGEVLEHSFRLTITPSLPPYPNSGRVRTIEELEYELNNLYLTVETLEKHENVVYGCVFDGLRPDMQRGTLQLVDESCVKTFSLRLSQPSDVDVNSSDVAAQVYSGSMNDVLSIQGVSNSSVTGRQHQIRVTKEQR